LDEEQKMRWENYFFCKGNNDFELFWNEYLKIPGKQLLFFVCKGFDPRMNIGIKKIMNCGSMPGKCICLELDEGNKSSSYDYKDKADKNFGELKQLFNTDESLKLIKIKMWSDDGRLTGSRNAVDKINKADLSDYTDIIIDISSMPRIIFIPLIAKLLFLLENHQMKTNLHIIVAENFALDENIRSNELYEEAVFIHGFGASLDDQSNIDIIKVWLPILGSGQNEKLIKINDRITPHEICPILPFPSRNPRRSDDLVIEYKDFIFEYPRVEPNNIIYVDEQNPFGVYRQICQTAKQYEESLDSLGGCKVIISPLSSKLLSLGALLAAYELDLGLTEVPAYGGYKMINNNTNHEIGKEELFELWVYGEPYE